MGVFVEIGSGFGTFLEEMTLKGAFETVLGIEPTPDLAPTCREKGLKIVERTVEEAARDGTLPQADVIVSFEVIEHLFDPGALVEYCGRLLVPGGVFVSQAPNWRVSIFRCSEQYPMQSIMSTSTTSLRARSPLFVVTEA